MIECLQNYQKLEATEPLDAQNGNATVGAIIASRLADD